MSEYRKLVTTQHAKSIGGMAGYACQQANAVRRYDEWSQ